MKKVCGHYILGGKVLNFEVICRYYNLRVYLAGNHIPKNNKHKKVVLFNKRLTFYTQ